MLVANLSKWDGLKDFLKRKQDPPKELGSDQVVLNQLLDLFVKGQDGTYNKHADFDYLAYVFADLSKHADIRKHFLEEQSYDKVIPITKLKVFTEHKSDIRRKGVASTIKNVAFEVSSHPSFLSEDEIDILPYILLPIMGNEEYDVDETMEWRHKESWDHKQSDTTEVLNNNNSDIKRMKYCHLHQHGCN